MFWTNVLSGAAGHTYGANGIWQLNRQGRPYGNSPHGGNYGTIPWDEAMKLPGSQQLGLGKRLLEAYPWHHFEPHPEWASWKEGDSRGFTWGDWIWSPGGDPTRDAPVAARAFRKTFSLPDGARIDHAVLRLTADDRFTAYLNGQLVGSHANWMSGREFADVGRLLRPGKNVLAVRGENAPGPKGANPAGLACNLGVVLDGGAKVVVLSDGTWRCSAGEEKGWQEPGFDDGSWEPARVIARFGEGPWGARIGEPDEFLVPYTAGIPGVVRIVYLPLPRAVTIHHLEPGKAYIARAFDPTSGRRQEIGAVRPDDAGRGRYPRPQGRRATGCSCWRPAARDIDPAGIKGDGRDQKGDRNGDASRFDGPAHADVGRPIGPVRRPDSPQPCGPPAAARPAPCARPSPCPRPPSPPAGPRARTRTIAAPPRIGQRPDAVQSRPERPATVPTRRPASPGRQPAAGRGRRTRAIATRERRTRWH